MEEAGLPPPIPTDGDKSELGIAPQSGRDQVTEEGLLANPDEPFIDLLRRYRLSLVPARTRTQGDHGGKALS